MAAITWRNVNGPSLGESSDILSAAGQSFNAGLGSLDKMLKQREAVQLANQEAVVKNNNNAFMADVDAIEDPVKLAAMKGQFAEQLKGYNGQVDPNLRNYLDTRTGVLNTRLDQERVRTDAERARAEAPIIEQFKIAGLNGDNPAQEAIIKANPNIKWAEHMTWDRNEEAAQDKRKREQKLIPLQHQAAITTAEDTIATQAETKVVKALEKEAATAVQAHQEQQRKIGLKLGGIVGTKGAFPVRADGTLDLANLTADQHKLLEGVAPAEYKQYVMGDTAAADTFVTSLNGRYSPEIVEKAKSTLRSQFNSNTAATLVGRDKDNLLVAEAKQQVDDDEKRGLLPFEPKSTGAMAIYNKFKPIMKDMIDKTTGWSPEEDVGDMDNRLYKIVTQGIDVDGVRMVPPESTIQMAITKADGGLFTDSERADEFEALLVEAMKAGGMRESLKEGVALNKRDLRRTATTKLNEARQPKK